MWHDIAFSLWFFIPAAVANVAPIFAVKLPGLKGWNAPLDFGKTFRGKRVFGAHKTWRGILSGIVVATLFLWIEQLLVIHYSWAKQLTRQLDYAGLPTLLLGPLFAIGALGGDALKSFFKRQRGIPSGKKWVPFDQLDYIIGVAIATLPVIRLTIGEYVWLFVLWFGIHILSTYIGWCIGVKDSVL